MLSQIRAFLAVIEEGSLHRAATRLALAGGGHVLFTAILGFLVAWGGMTLTDKIGSTFPLIAGDEEQARRIRAIEEKFHGSGDPFTRPAHTQAETREHHRAMAAEMNPEDGRRFFRAQEGSELSVSPK